VKQKRDTSKAELENQLKAVRNELQALKKKMSALTKGKGPAIDSTHTQTAKAGSLDKSVKGVAGKRGGRPKGLPKSPGSGRKMGLFRKGGEMPIENMPILSIPDKPLPQVNITKRKR
jgi:hypothetical protein